MNSGPFVFLGLVSHPKSRYKDAQGPQGLFFKLSELLEGHGISTAMKVNSDSLFDQSPFQLTARMARDSVRTEIELESAWRSYLGEPKRIRQQTRIAARYAKFRLKWRAHSELTELRRLLNIEYSHVDLYRSAVASAAQWAIILEDDSSTSDLGDLVEGILGLLRSEMSAKLVNLSASFSMAEIGVQHLLTVDPAAQWDGTSARVTYQSKRPATNTVCAIAFRTDFLAQILADFDAQPAHLIVPIGWKLNATLMRLWDAGAIGVNECWFVEPAPIVQLSMVQDREGK